jgi:hypothetical protein
MPRRSVEKTNLSQERGKGTSDEPNALDLIKESSGKIGDPLRDRVRRREVGSSSDLSEKIALPANFIEIGGNTELAKAQVILLGELIASHYKDIVSFINAHAKKGDIVLVESKEAGKEESRFKEAIGKDVESGVLSSDCANAILSDKESKKEYFKSKGKDLLFREDLKLYGWDDMNAWGENRKLLVNIMKIPSNEEGNQFSELRAKFLDRLPDIDDKRVRKMLETIENMRNRFSDKKLFVVASESILFNTIQREELGKQPYIALMTKKEATKEEKEEYGRVIGGLMQEVTIRKNR